jgi:hypothetical protein
MKQYSVHSIATGIAAFTLMAGAVLGSLGICALAVLMIVESKTAVMAARNNTGE